MTTQNHACRHHRALRDYRHALHAIRAGGDAAYRQLIARRAERAIDRARLHARAVAADYAPDHPALAWWSPEAVDQALADCGTIAEAEAVGARTHLAVVADVDRLRATQA